MSTAADALSSGSPFAIEQTAFAAGQELLDEVKDVPVLGTIASFAAPAAAIALASLAMRYRRAQQKAAVGKSRAIASQSGVKLDLAGGAALGFGPQEAAGISEGFARSVGFNMAGGPGVDLMRLLATGAGVSSIAGYVGQRAPGAGGLGGDPARVLALAFEQGLRGSNLDAYLSIIASSTSSLAARGLETNVSGTEDLLARMLGTDGMGRAGLRAPRSIAAMAEAAGGARDQLMGPFRQLGQQALLAQAMQRGGGRGYMGVLAALEQMTAGDGGAAGATRDAVRRMFPSMASEYFASTGLMSDEARAVAGPLGDAAGGANLRDVERDQQKRRGLAAAIAGKDLRLLSGLSESEARQLIKHAEAMEVFMDKVGKYTQGSLDVLDKIYEAIRSWL